MQKFTQLSDKVDNVAHIALEWCNQQTETLTDEEKLDWARERINRRSLIRLEKPNNQLFIQLKIHRLDIFTWAPLVADVSLLCAKFYLENASEIPPETAELISTEAAAIALLFPEPPVDSKPVPEVKFVEIDGVTYLKGTENSPSPFVISKFL